MPEQKVDTDQLRALTETLQGLIDYTAALRDGSAGFAYMLPAEWQGPAFAQFLAAFELWSTTAESLRQQAESLRGLSQSALSAYETTISELDSQWSSIRSGLGA
jgi:uncharacterized protein YukE